MLCACSQRERGKLGLGVCSVSATHPFSMRFSFHALLCVAVLAPLATSQTKCLSTVFARNNGGSLGGAVYLDVNVKNTAGITITSIETNTSETVAFSVDLHTTPGTRVGNETNAAVWTLVASGSAVGLGADVPTPIDTTDFSLKPGTYGLAVVMSATAGHDYTNGSGSNQLFSNSDLELSLGGASNVPFTGSIFDPRVWNGTICYEEQAECFLVLGTRAWNYTLGQDTLLVEPLLMVPMTLTNLPVFNVPAQGGLVGATINVQAMMYMPSRFPNDPLKLSHAIKYTIGVDTATYGTGTGLGLWALGPKVVQPGGQIAIDFSIN